MLKILLNPLEEKIYIFILDNPFSSISTIAKETKTHRPLTYKIIKKLLNKKYILIQKQNKRKTYLSENPQKIYDDFVSYEFKIKNLANELKERYNKNLNEVKVSEYKGKYSIRSAVEELIANTEKNSNLYRIESISDEIHLKYYYGENYKKRAYDSGDLKKYVITNRKKGLARTPRLNRYTKLVDEKEQLLEDNIFSIISDKNVLFVDAVTDTGFLFEGEKFANFQKSIFKMLYKKL